MPEKVFHFTRAIDYLGIFNAALTEEEINKIMKQGLVGAFAVASTNRLTSIWSVVKTKLNQRIEFKDNYIVASVLGLVVVAHF